MNKYIATFFIVSCIALLVNSTPIDIADNAKLSTRVNDQYEVTPMPTGPLAPRSQDLHEVSNDDKSGDLPSNAPPPVAAPVVVAQNSSNGTVSPPEVITTTVPTKPTTTSIPTLPTLTPTNQTTNATTTTVAPANTTTLPPTTTPVTPATNATTTTNAPTPTPVPVTTPSTTPAAASTTPAPAPSKDRRFDGPSFIGGIVLSLGIMAIGFVAWKFYKARTERNYHTL